MNVSAHNGSGQLLLKNVQGDVEFFLFNWGVCLSDRWEDLEKDVKRHAQWKVDTVPQETLGSYHVYEYNRQSSIIVSHSKNQTNV